MPRRAREAIEILACRTSRPFGAVAAWWPPVRSSRESMAWSLHRVTPDGGPRRGDGSRRHGPASPIPFDWTGSVVEGARVPRALRATTRAVRPGAGPGFLLPRTAAPGGPGPAPVRSAATKGLRHAD